MLTLWNLSSDYPLVESTYYFQIMGGVHQWSNIGVIDDGDGFEDNKVTCLTYPYPNLECVRSSEGDLLSLLPLYDPDYKVFSLIIIIVVEG